MKLLLTVQLPGVANSDVALTTDSNTTVGDVAQALLRRRTDEEVSFTTPTLLVTSSGSTQQSLDPRLPVAEAPVGSGDLVSVGEATTVTGGSGLELKVLSGPDAGRRVPLPTGLSSVGRDPACNIVLSDPMISKRHANIIVGDVVEVLDDNSANGVISSGETVQRLVLSGSDRFTIGESVMTVDGMNTRSGAPSSQSGTVAFNRSPRLDPYYVGREFIAPEPPQLQPAQRVPLISALAPLLMGFVLFAITKSVLSVAFIALSPLMLVGSYFENRRVVKRQLAEDTEVFEQNLTELVAQLRVAHDEERVGRCHEHPSTAEVVDAIKDLSPLTWTRRPEHDSFLSLRLGLGRQLSRVQIEMPQSRKSPIDLLHQLEQSVAPFAVIDEVPVVCHLGRGGCLGVSGPSQIREVVTAGLVVQLIGLHSPAELSLVAVASASSASRWDWLKWLPHVESEHSPLGDVLLASTAGSVASLIADLTGLIDERLDNDNEAVSHLPAVVVLVEDDGPFVRSSLVQVAERGRSVGVHVVWFADRTADLPAVCRTFLELEPNSFGAATGKVIEGERVEPLVIESVDHRGTEWIGRRLAPVVDASVAADSESDVPTSVSFVAEAGSDLVSDPSFVIERWLESNSIRSAVESSRPLKRDNSLRALVGRTASESLHLDLRAQGPHALVGGTTGAGKSEFLQTWVLAMAAAHSPQRVTFLFVDYKGGAAFADCVSLPHSVGLVTDLSPHLVQRALRSLNAELRHREHILNRKRAKDLLELERRGDPEAPPSLVIVVDEFAALVQEVPEFVDGVVNVAQRGRSLGLHLILATQRPAGVIKGNLRANTNLRVALRMADRDDSSDVIGVDNAADFDPEVPGRGIVRTGPGRLSLFQTGYVGGVTSSSHQGESIELRDLAFGRGGVWDDDWIEEGAVIGGSGATTPDIERVVSNICRAATQAELEPPRKPWLPELADAYDLANLPTKRTDAALVFGVVDHPDDQEQGIVEFRPDIDGSMMILGTGGSGKSTAMRSLAVAAGLTARGGPCHVFGLDFGSRGLSMLDVLPHVGSIIGGEDVERTSRLFRRLRDMVDERAARYSKVNAGTIEEYRRLAEDPAEPRIILMLDGYGAFRTAFEMGPHAWFNEALLSLAGDGRPLGLHVVMSADRPGVVPASLNSVIQKKLVLKLASENDIIMSGVPKDAFNEDTPAGRGFVDREEVQVAVLGGAADTTSQARSLEKFARSMSRAGTSSAPPVEVLSEKISLLDLPMSIDGFPVFGLADESLSPLAFDPSGTFLVAGPSGSGRTTAVATVVEALRRNNPNVVIAYFGHRRSPLASRQDWDHAAVGTAECAALATTLAETLRGPADAAQPSVVVLDGMGEFLNSEADFPFQELLKACRANGAFVIAEGDSGEVGGSWPLLQAIRASRHGLVLQPDQTDGDVLFKTTFQRMKRADFPVGRGMYVRQGRAQRVQVALPE